MKWGASQSAESPAVSNLYFDALTVKEARVASSCYYVCSGY